ncbi:MAG: HipA domain-containing protein [Flavobacteriales bacterium]|nr:HipA domain-containing protein [Flavobacteriales bacterium]
MPLEFYPVIELKPEWVRAEEQMGSKKKYWVDAGAETQWLFKFARVNNSMPTGEHWAEKIAAEVAELMDLPHARVELATLQGRNGSLSLRFNELSNPGTALVHGNVLLPGQVLGYDPLKKQRQSDHTLGNILRVVDHVFAEREDRNKALDTFMGYLVLDALVMNTDRHHENWALVRYTSSAGTEEHGLAPTFDHASSLGRELTEEKIQSWAHDAEAVARYVSKARGAIYRLNTDERGLSPMELVSLALRVKGEHVRPWLERLHTLDPQSLVDIVVRVPPSVMSERHRSFASELLRYTLNRLQHMNA